MSSPITSPASSELMPLMRIEESTFLDTQSSTALPDHTDSTWLLDLRSMQFPSFFELESLSSNPIPGPSAHPSDSETLSSYNGTANSSVVDLFQKPEFDNTAESDVMMPTLAEATHAYRRISGTENEILEEWLKISEAPDVDRKVIQCIWPGCTTKPFTGKCEALRHVLEHLGIRKLYECVSCTSKFATRGTATRHVQSQRASFSCSFCPKAFKREDYWRKHVRICGKKFRAQ